jgi:polysaccharide export outer membrane protein
MFTKFWTRALAIVFACALPACWSEISAQVQSAAQNDAIGAKAPVAYALDKSAPPDITSTDSTAASASPSPEPAAVPSPAPAATPVPPSPEPAAVPSPAPAATPVPPSPEPTAAPSPAPATTPAPGVKARPEMTPQSAPKDKPDESYVVGIADELQISVWKEPDLSGPVVVRPDGMITVPVVDDVAVVGLTTKQVQDILTEKLKPVVDQPQVTVIVRNIRSRKVYLVGQVGHPGGVSLNGHETVLQILAESGGPSLYAKADKIYILRQVGGHQQRLNFNYKKALKGGDPQADFQLESGDVIVVP